MYIIFVFAAASEDKHTQLIGLEGITLKSIQNITAMLHI
jgi:hypothetical protein